MTTRREFLEIAAGRLKPGKQMTRDYVVTDRNVWRSQLAFMREQGLNMVWSDRICNGKEEFLKQMPKSVLQLPWCYHADYSEKTVTWDPSFEKRFSDMSSQRNLAASIRILAEAGFDILPCTGNWHTDESADAMLAYCKKRIDPARIKGFLTASWKLSVPETDAKVRDAIRLLAEAKRKHGYHI